MQARTIYQKFEETAKKFPQHVAIGFKDGSHYRTLTYKKFLERINKVVTGLKNLGVGAEDKVAIFSRNRSEWVELDLALNKIGAISVPIHITLSPRIIEYIINDSGVKFLAIGDYLSKYFEIKSKIQIQNVITFPKIEWQEDFIHFHEFYKEAEDASEPAEGKIASIIYTSGTTGDPKGVMLSNDNFIQNVLASVQYIPLNHRDVFLSFMPLSHVLERTGGCYAPLFHGAAVYFASSYKTIGEDIKKAHPTVMISVPRLFEKVYEKVLAKVLGQKSKFKENLFFGSLKTSRAYLNSKKQRSAIRPLLLLGHFFSDWLVLRKIRAQMGGNLRFAVSGGAPLDSSIARFFETLGIKILEGYGLTETSPIIAVNPLDNYKFNTVGKIIPGVEVKISSDKEILVKGHNVMAGYSNPEANSEAFEDGWFKTGDLGFMDHEGYLTIIGRKKEMLVLSTGKNVSPTVLEIALQKSPYISQAMVFGDNHKFVRALIVPDYEQVKKFCEEKGINMDWHNLVKSTEVKELIRQEVSSYLKDFPDNEMVRDFILLEKPFSEEREELTPTLKLRRDKILQNYKSVISA